MQIHNKILLLIEQAQAKMKHSKDPIHDIKHVRRVVSHAQRLAHDLSLNERETQALVLSAWWHDVGRTITRKPSFLWMVLFDDLISAVLLWRETVRFGLFGSVAGMATRLIFCKSVGTGSLLTKILLRKKTRLLLNLLKDADNLDLISIQRFKVVMNLSSESIKNQYAFRMLIWFNIQSTTLRLKTKQALRYFEQLLRELTTWVRQQKIVTWFTERFGKKWVEKTLQNLDILLHNVITYNLVTSS